MGKYTILFLFFFLPVITYGQYSISARVIDASNKQPLIGASVFCENTTIGSFTDQQGNCWLKLSPGGYTLIISHTGYKMQKIQITGAVTLEIRMEREDIKMKEVIVKA